MKNLLFKNKKLESSIRLTDYLADQTSGLYVEDYFNELLSLERKRTERSRKPFLLMLLSIKETALYGTRQEVIKKIASALFSSTREIDVKGWYKYDSVIGVIFAEMNGIDKNSVELKIYNSLNKVLTPEQMRRIEISFHVFPEDPDDQRPHRPPDLNLYPDLSRRNSSKKPSLLLKRVIDIIGGITGLVVFSPLFVIIALSIKLSSKGPILFKQERVGLFGKRFTFLKFRSMYVDNDPNIHKEYIKQFICEQKAHSANDGNGQNRVYKIEKDPRVTPVGRLLRKTSLDELPQFLNVLKGEMSLVGPRPPIPYELENYDIWHRRRVLEVKPGITGLWQVKGRSFTTFDEMVRLDLKYVREWSLWLDIKILFQTPWVVLSGKGAY
jgi:lipopolysaccharide/colanic/teichoic acid biosynthesis glycosyltransferase